MMNKILKKLGTVLMCAVILFALPLSASARRPLVDFTQKGSITFNMFHDGKPVNGGTWSIYRVADIAYDEDYNLYWVKTPDFASHGCDFNTIDLTKGNEDLRSHIEYYNIGPLREKTLNNGTVTFDNLTPALYYICQWHNAPGFYRSGAFFINIPQYDETTESYIYDVTVEPKTQMSPDGQDYPTPPPSGPTPPPTIPDTGITQWPVPVFAMCGIMLFAFGWYQFRKGERK